jgi:HlyD family secretion protein
MNDFDKGGGTTGADQRAIEALLGGPTRSPWRRRLIYAAGAVLLIILVLVGFRLFNPKPDASYAAQPAKRGDLTVTVSATGNLQPTNEVQVGSEQSGLVTSVFVDNNDRVQKGQALARLDTSRLTDATTQARATLAAAQAQVATAQASEAQSKANIARLEEVWRISRGQVPSKTELDAGRADYQRAVAGVQSARAQVQQARAQLSSAETNLRKATIYSPVDGVVLSRQVDPGQTVAASLQAPVLFSIGEDLARMDLEVRIDEADVAQVDDGQKATFTVDAFPGKTFPAQVGRVDVGANASGSTTSSASSTSSSSSGSSSNTVIAYTAVLNVNNSALQLRPGMTATAAIVTAERRNVLLIPNAALRFRPGDGGQRAGRPGGVTGVLMARPNRRGNRAQREVAIGRGASQTIFVLQNEKPEPITVTVGETDGTMTEVVGGELKPGMQVITGRLSGERGKGGQGQGQRRRGGGGGG